MIYITEQEAVLIGLTHEGSFLGIPVWLDFTDLECPGILCKFVPFEALVPVFSWVYMTVFRLKYPYEEPLWPIKIGKKLTKTT